MLTTRRVAARTKAAVTLEKRSALRRRNEGSMRSAQGRRRPLIAPGTMSRPAHRRHRPPRVRGRNQQTMLGLRLPARLAARPWTLAGPINAESMSFRRWHRHSNVRVCRLPLAVGRWPDDGGAMPHRRRQAGEVTVRTEMVEPVLNCPASPRSRGSCDSDQASRRWRVETDRVGGCLHIVTLALPTPSDVPRPATLMHRPALRTSGRLAGAPEPP